MSYADELGDLEVTVYRCLLEGPDQPVSRVAAALGRRVADLNRPLARLTEMGLVRTQSDGRLTAVSPMLAEATVLGAEDLELAARRAALEARRNTIRRLVPDWNSALEPAALENTVDVVTEPAKIGNVLMHYADQCREELLSVAPGRLPKTRIDTRTRIANLYSLRRGIKTRALYQQHAIRDRHTRSYLTDMADNGAKIRFAAAVPGRSLVIDRDVALLPIPGARPGDQGLAIVREVNVISWVVATFEQLWAEAIPLEEIISAGADDAKLDQTRAAILRLLAEGEKDEAIARRLSISVRTCRRHIADYMVQVGATSRFQAGVIAARSGHADSTAD